MKIAIIGAGNMGGAIACGLVIEKNLFSENITVIDHKGNNVARLKAFDKTLNVVVADYSSLDDADIIIIAVKPWAVHGLIENHRLQICKPKQLIISVASGITLEDLRGWCSSNQPIFRVMPNTAISVRQSMTYISSLNATDEQNQEVFNLFSLLGKAEFIDEKLLPAATSLASCGIAFAFRYIRAAMEGGVEMGIYPDKAKNAVLQTLRGAIDLLEANGTHPESEIDKVTTAGGITIKGLNEMEHAGFSSSVIKGLKASNLD